jgi:hypothetical protein
VITGQLDVSRSIAESGYVGWVVWVDGAPVFQEVPVNLNLQPLVYGATDITPRKGDRQTVDWKDLDQTKIERIEVYGFHEEYTEQPLMRIDRQPGAAELRFCCLTMQALAFGPGILGQARTGVAGWKLGWYNPHLKEFDLWEIKREGRNRLNPSGSPVHLPSNGNACKGHPCWPRPYGFGIAPYVFGLKDYEVPNLPAPVL